MVGGDDRFVFVCWVGWVVVDVFRVVFCLWGGVWEVVGKMF